MSDLIKYLEKFISSAEPKIRTRAKGILPHIDAEDITVNTETELAADVMSTDGETYYETALLYYNRTGIVTGSCDCPYAGEYDDICKHQVALGLKWADGLKKAIATAGEKMKGVKEAKQNASEQKHKNIQVIDFPFMKISYGELHKFAPGFLYSQASGMMHHYKTDLKEVKEERKWVGTFINKVEAAVVYKDTNSITVSCTCGKLDAKTFCQHTAAILLFISYNRSPYYFYQFNDYTAEKKQLLQQFGLSPADELAKKFEFSIDVNGQFVISKKPAYLLGALQPENWNKIKSMLGKPQKTTIINLPSLINGEQDYEAGVLFNFNNEKKGFLSIEPLLVFDKKGNRRFKRIPFDQPQHAAYLLGMPEGMVNALKKLTTDALTAHLVKNGYGYLKQLPNPLNQLSQAQIDLLNELRYAALLELKPFGSVFKNIYHLPAGEKFAHDHIKAASISVFVPSLHFKLSREKDFLQLQCLIVINNEHFAVAEFERIGFLLRSRSEYFVLRKADFSTLDVFKDGMLMVHEKEQAAFITTIVKPLAATYTVDLGDIVKKETIDDVPIAQVYVSELNENFLLIKLQWLYASLVAEDWEEAETIVEKDNTIYTILRKKETEQTVIEAIRKLHDKFTYQSNNYFYLSFKEALQKNWFLQFYNALQQLGVPVFGIDRLKKFRYNPHPPTLEIKAGSSIDWFDLSIEVSYGDLPVPLHELRKAIISKQNFILLSDGSLGVLPEEWIQKYGMLMRMGQVNGDALKVAKTSWTIVEQLQQQINDTALVEELQAKKKRLQQIDAVTTHAVPKKIKATLRHYQKAGFQWMCLLDEIGWGGCLADDMGLGKTLQTICFLQHLSETYPKETHLVVCPTSLIYNWEAELKKFAPALDFHIHYGADRVFDKKVFSKAHLIITSYGMVRSDIEHFSNYPFGYVVLDESQAIKNPASQITKAVQLLKSRNRIALSGTPVQNNTFDLFAQLHFLNPGMLGSQEFFKTEFATPIDKNGDKEKTAALRQLIYPFMLRRTKEQVAKDLPNKTEMILWCEMDEVQRKIYNSFKDHYRESLLGRIAEDGMGKSSIYILEGLTKLRQICDSPAILNEEETYPNESIKQAELVREISENVGQHKALVFSQFTSMLQLTAAALKEKNIAYLYLDGSTPAANRKKLVQQFQEDAAVPVFLISLKAGGVGLNLTAADYVYLVDPWWNPAVEQQAIDRTHRIGQVKKVFAYRMICKDTVEEKIMALQEKKKALAAGLISDEAGFVKKLTKDDVAYLFS